MSTPRRRATTEEGRPHASLAARLAVALLLLALAVVGAVRTVAWARSEISHQAGWRAWQQREHATAVARLAEGLARDPANAELCYLHAQLLVDPAARLLRDNPAEAATRLAEVDRLLARAERSFLTPSRIARTRAEVLDLLSQAHFRARDNDASLEVNRAALESFRRSERLSPDALARPAVFYGDMMLASVRAGDQAQAAWSLRQVHRFAGPRAIDRRGLPDHAPMVLAATGNFPAVMNEIRRRVLADPSNELLVGSFVETALGLGEAPAAAVAFEALERRRLLTRFARGQWDRLRAAAP